ncbi:hypothetical protein [Nocardia huaxiensis]|uniref:Small secreted domain DUF320 n=1 Tax=Nocardia huaxiensis TaxID=2755382 RepID=A0A7D6VCV3_9NOCA|nr:hypothetical protein [Nocardia huaxiensis]QLY29837.1 hypothetical protein H0264_32250 [Nocardia huaxiensis]UFS96574.1 hypothetical protein LPY97_01120 [Nocardia huaxiensis]
MNNSRTTVRAVVAATAITAALVGAAGPAAANPATTGSGDTGSSIPLIPVLTTLIQMVCPALATGSGGENPCLSGSAK